MVGKRAKDNNLNAAQVNAELANFDPKDPATINEIRDHIDQYARDLAGGSDFNWFGRYGRKGSGKDINPFDSTARGRDYLPRIDNSVQPINNNPSPTAQQSNSTNTQSNPQPNTTNPQPNSDAVIQALRDDIADFGIQLDESQQKIMDEVADLKSQIELNQTVPNTISSDEVDARIANFEKQIKALVSKLDILKDAIKSSGKSDIALIKQAKDLTAQIASLEKQVEDIKNYPSNP
jgi:polyhydroxyalkanoate synthesis regulator phasin